MVQLRQKSNGMNLSGFIAGVLALILFGSIELRGQLYNSAESVLLDCKGDSVKWAKVIWTKDLLESLVGYSIHESEHPCLMRILEKAISDLQEENSRLDFILEALKVNPQLGKYFPRWTVRDPRYQIETLWALGIPGLIPQVVDSVRYALTLIQDPSSVDGQSKSDLLKLVLGNEVDTIMVVERGKLRSLLGWHLYSRLQARDYAHDMLGSSLSQQHTNYASVSLSLLGGEALIHISDAVMGPKLELGRESIGYPFYYGATWNLLATYRPQRTDAGRLPDTYEFGLQIPFHPAEKSAGIFGPATFKQRRINGAHGVIGRFDKQISGRGSLGGEFSIAALTEKGDSPIVDWGGVDIEGDAGRTFSYLSGNLHLYYSMNLSSLGLQGLTFAMGFGYYQMRHARLDTGGINTRRIGQLDRFDFYGKLSYSHSGTVEYSLALQYFDFTFVGSACLRLFEWLSLEAKYARIVFRNPRPWEHRDLLALSPRLAFTFSF